MKRIILSLLPVIFYCNVLAQNHPVLITPSELTALASGNSAWSEIDQYCSDHLNSVVEPGWAGWDWRIAIENYARAYQVLKTSDPVLAEKYAKKTLALMKAAARHHNMGGPENHYSLSICGQYIGLGNGAQTNFTLPFAPMSGSAVTVILSDVQQVSYTYTSSKNIVGRFDPILKVSNTNQGAANYSSSDYHLDFRQGSDIHVLNWLTGNHPASGSTYYVTYYNGNDLTVNAANYSISGTTLTFTTAPAAGKAVFVRMIGADYEQTGNYLGGKNSVQPDGPGYQMRTFNPGLAFGFDLLYDYAGFTADLKEEFVNVLNDQIDWYEAEGYERDGDLGNYFIRGLYTGMMFTAYGTEGANTRTAYLKQQTDVFTERIYNKLATSLPSGYGPQGQYANGTITDILQTFTIYQGLTGEDLLSQLEWTANTIPAIIHGTKPNRTTFYDGGDWDQLPAQPLTDGVRSFLQYQPGHAMAPYARQLLMDAGESDIPSGTVTDYKTVFPLAYLGKVSGPVYTRSSWATDAVWASFSAGEIFMDHTHFDQGHFTIQRGGDYLVIDAGGYGDYKTDPWHNTLLIDDRDAGNISTYPPGQGAWGFGDTRITRFEERPSYTYSAANITRSYARHHDGIQNSVSLAYRSFLFIRPHLVIVHDKVKTGNAGVRKIFNCNFPAPPSLSGGVYTVTKGASKLFYKPVVPSGIAPVIVNIPGKDANYRNLQVTQAGASNHNFLNVFEAVASTTASMTATRYIFGETVEGLEISKTDSTWAAVFAKTDTLINTDYVYYTFTNSGGHRHVVADLNKLHEYEVTVYVGTSKPLDRKSVFSSSQGIVSFAFNAAGNGVVVIAKKGVTPPEPTDIITATSSQAERHDQNAYISGDQLHILWSTQKPVDLHYKMYSIDGHLLVESERTLEGGNNHITQYVGDVPAGIYIVRVGDGAATTSFKTVKQH